MKKPAASRTPKPPATPLTLRDTDIVTHAPVDHTAPQRLVVRTDVHAGGRNANNGEG